MAGAWVKISDIWQYKYTKGDHIKANKHAIHHKLQVPEAGKKVYEEVAPKEMKEDRNHIVIYHGEKKIVDSDVPQLAKRASQWDHVRASPQAAPDALGMEMLGIVHNGCSPPTAPWRGLRVAGLHICCEARYSRPPFPCLWKLL